MEFHHPPTNDFDDSPTIQHPQILMHICETVCYRVIIDYIQPFDSHWLPKEVGTKITGG